ncbi:MAG: TetR/AcrR family transcriptional regulator, partial [Spirochaetes bacterium]|nr:TetR/AcrR family transcriptional regulator [Spirochaetota bacterium]
MVENKNTKERIFEIAVELFSQKGFHGTSIRDIAKQVGIKESSLYNHFSSKSAILDSILQYHQKSFEEALPSREEMEATAANFTDPVKLWLQGTMDFVKRLPPLSEQISYILHNEMFLNIQCRDFVLNSMFHSQK